ncbi:MAG TPA: ribose-5-phosphate isomerase A, partial [Saprospiraceae bacterium]|nr:ribose-5-phosphate isomerase A [Saprospiraceae bacterium]
SKPFITDQGNYILDCHFSLITDPQQLNTDIQLIPGVVETGLFVGMADKAITGYADGSIEFIEF